MSTVAVVVTCHGEYLSWLPDALTSIDRQYPQAAERVVVFDGCDVPDWLSPDWKAYRGQWGHPSPARNHGMAHTSAPWLVFWDADNVMPPGFLEASLRAVRAAPPEVGIVYSDVQLCDMSLRPAGKWTMPEWDYWALRAENYVDTAAVWRREAIDLAGGWSTRANCFEDYALALDITERGWKAKKRPGPPVLMRQHENSRMGSRAKERQLFQDIWKARSLAIVTLLAGRQTTLPIWEEFLLGAELPPKTSLYVVDNSGSPEFHHRALAACDRIAGERGLRHMDLTASGTPYEPRPGEPYLTRERHLHVARLYGSVLPRVREDLVLTLEDDIAPPPFAIRALGEQIGFPSWGKYGAVAGAYDMGDGHLCGGRDDGGLGSSIAWSDLPPHPIDAGCVGGGCTVWANWVLADLPVNFWWHQGLGWDWSLSSQIRRRGYRLRIHGGVHCVHHLHGSLRETIGGPLVTLKSGG
jgi:glycosyltransferase involved in cell wall biosynthesis